MVYLALGAFLVGAAVYLYRNRHPNSASRNQELYSKRASSAAGHKVARNTQDSEQHEESDTWNSSGVLESSYNESPNTKLKRRESASGSSPTSPESTPKARPQDGGSSIPSISLGRGFEEDPNTTITQQAPPAFADGDVLHTTPQPNPKPQSSSSTPSAMAPPPKPSTSLEAKPKRPTSSLMPPPSRPIPKPTSTLLPPPSTASTLRAPPSRSLNPSSSSLAPTSSSLPPSSRPSRKVLLAPGHSPLDWAHLVAHPPNPTFLRGASLPPNLIRVPPSMLRYHNGRKGRDAWGVWQGKVYNLTPYLEFHPGGKGELMRGAGKDGPTMLKLFNEVHPWVSWEGMLGECLVGIMVSEEEVVDGKGAGEGRLDEMD